MKGLIVGLIIVASVLFGVHFTHANPKPLPSTLQANGYGPYESGLIQPKQSPWYVTLDATPLNNSVSVTILDQNHEVQDYKLLPTTTASKIVYKGDGTTPIYVESYARNWKMSLTY